MNNPNKDLVSNVVEMGKKNHMRINPLSTHIYVCTKGVGEDVSRGVVRRYNLKFRPINANLET